MAKLSLQPLDDRIVVKRADAETQSAGGIFLPESAKEKPQKGSVLAVGAGKLLDSGERATPDLAEGDLVLFGKYAGTEITVDGEDVIILRESDILAKIG
jgi:chaperonin GroES